MQYSIEALSYLTAWLDHETIDKLFELRRAAERSPARKGRSFSFGKL